MGQNHATSAFYDVLRLHSLWVLKVPKRHRLLCNSVLILPGILILYMNISRVQPCIQSSTLYWHKPAVFIVYWWGDKACNHKGRLLHCLVLAQTKPANCDKLYQYRGSMRFCTACSFMHSHTIVPANSWCVYSMMSNLVWAASVSETNKLARPHAQLHIVVVKKTRWLL